MLLSKYLIFLPFISCLMIVLNVYNGDILGIPSDFEYLLWYTPVIISSICELGIKKSLYIYHTCYLGIILMIFWYYESPFRSTKKIRHRTEYYDTHALLCGLIYHTIYEIFR